MLRKPLFVSIGTKITIMMLTMVVVSAVFISLYSYYNYRGDSIKLQGNAALAAANSLAAAIDVERFKEGCLQRTKRQCIHDKARHSANIAGNTNQYGA